MVRIKWRYLKLEEYQLEYALEICAEGSIQTLTVSFDSLKFYAQEKPIVTSLS